jgi:hypothetical protein
MVYAPQIYEFEWRIFKVCFGKQLKKSRIDKLSLENKLAYFDGLFADGLIADVPHQEYTQIGDSLVDEDDHKGYDIGDDEVPPRIVDEVVAEVLLANLGVKLVVELAIALVEAMAMAGQRAVLVMHGELLKPLHVRKLGRDGVTVAQGWVALYSVIFRDLEQGGDVEDEQEERGH